MTKEQFRSLFNQASNEVADEFYPKNELVWSEEEQAVIKSEKSKRRGEYLRDQAVLYVKLEQLLWSGMFLEEP